MAFDVEGALKAGYSEQEIANFLGQQRKFDTQAAIASGYSPSEIIQHLAQAPVKQAPWSVSDTLVSAAQGAVGGVKSLVTGLTGAGTGASEAFDPAQKWLGEKLSPERRAEQQRRALLEQEAAKTGKPLEEVAAGLGGIKEAPVQSVAQGIGSAVPTVLLGAGAAALGAAVGAPVAIAAGVGVGIKYLLGAIQGAGEVKGSIYDAVKQELEANKVPEAAAKQQAAAAQDYLGKNWDVIAAGMGLGALAGGTGAESTLLKRLSKPVAERAAADVGKATVQKGAAREFAGAVAKEAGTEGLQGGQEKYAENVALTREGYLRDAMAGVYGAAARDAAMGALTGAAVQPLAAKRPAAEQPPVQEPPPPEQELRPTPPPPPLEGQGELFTPEEMGEGQAPKAPRTPRAPRPAVAPGEPGAQLDLGLDYQREVEQLYLERERLRQQPKTPETRQRIAELTDQILSYEEMTEADRRAQADIEAEATAEAARQDAEARKRFPALAKEPVAETPPAPETPPVAETTTPTAEPPIPAKPGAITATEIKQFGTMSKKNRQWLVDNVEGKTPEEVRDMVEADPTILTKVPGVAKAIKEIIANAAPKEAPRATTTEVPTVEQPVEPGGREPSVGVPSEPAGAVPSGPGAGGAPAATTPATPDQRGLVPIEQPAGKGNVPEGEARAPLTGVLADLQNATNRDQFNAAMDRILAVQRDRKHPEHKTVQEFIENALRYPDFAAAMDAASTRAKPTPAPAAPLPTVEPGMPRKGAAPIAEKSPLPSAEWFEPIGTGPKGVVRGPQQTLLPVTDAEARKQLAANAARRINERPREAAPEAPAGVQSELDFTAPPEAAKPVEAAKPSKASKIDKTPTKRQQRVQFGKGIGAKQLYPGMLQARFNAKAKTAAQSGDFAGVLTALAESKNVTVAEVARLAIAAKLKTKITIDDDVREIHTVRDRISDQITIDSARAHIELLDALRDSTQAIRALPDGPLGKEAAPILSKKFSFYENGEPIGSPQTIRSLVDSGLGIVTQRPLPLWEYFDVPLKQTTKADLVRLLEQVERQTESVGEERLRRNATATTGYSAVAGAYDPETDEIKVTDLHAKDEGVLAHEIVHALVANTIANPPPAKRPVVARLTALYQHVKSIADAQGKEFYGVSSVQEFVSEGLANPDFQYFLSTIPYERVSVWERFTKFVADLIGAKHNSAFTELLSTFAELTTGPQATSKASVGKLFALSPTSEALIAGSGAVDPVEEGALKRMIKVINGTPELDYVTKFRTQTADIAATIESRLTATFDGKVRDSLGKVNPMGLYRQAQDYTKMLLEFFQQGSLVKNPDTKLWEVTTAKDANGNLIRPPADVYKLIDAWGEKNGWTREEATQKASRILEAVRLDGLRTANRTQGATFTLHKINESSPLSIDQQIDALLADYRADPALKEMNKLMDESRNALVDHLVDVGRLTPDQGADWKEVIGYVPFDRVSEDVLEKFSKVKRISGKGLAQVGKLPELKGTTRLAVGNVFNSYIDTMGWMVGQVVKTDATVQTLRSLEKVTSAKFLGTSAQGRPNIVGMYVKGVMNYWELPTKYDVMAFKDFNPPKANWLLQLGAFSNVLRKSITALPPFALKQVTDDVQRAIFTSGVKNPGALLRMTLTNFPKLAFAELRGITHPTVKEFGALGLTGEYDFQAGKPASSLLKDIGVLKRGKWENLLHRLDGITRASDLAVRKAIYDQTLKEGGDKLLAQTRAREFINFRRRGASDFVGAMVTTIPFFNAYVQGMDVLYRAASGKDSSSSIGRAQARRMFWGRMAIAATLSSLYALGKDDEDEEYKNMDLRTRDSNWVFSGGYKLPVPGELGAFFKVIPERIVEYMRRQGTPEEQEAFEAVRTTLTYMFEQYAGRMVPIPQAIKPVMEAWANKSFLTGRPLEGFHQQMMDPSMRVTEQTSELAKAIANFSRDTIGAEVSPIMIDNALRGYFGSTAALLTATTDSLLNPTRVDRPLHKWALLSTYLYDPVGTRRMTEFYEERETMGKANATLNQLMKTDMARAEQYAEAHQDDLVFESAINSTLEELERTRAYRNFLNSPDGAKEMSADEREAEMKEIKQYEAEMVKWVREAKTDYA